MWFSRDTNGFRGWLVVVDGSGTLVTGLGPGAFTVTIVVPDDSASTTSSVSESTQKGGMYTFEIASSFLVSNGPGNYGVVIEVVDGPSNVSDVVSGVLIVSRQDFDSLGRLGNAILGNVV